MTDDLDAYAEARTREARNDPRATPEFVTLALTEPDEDAAWDAVVTLHYRGTRDVFDTACHLCRSECPQERTLGANILGQLGIPKRAFPAESVKFLLERLEVETDEDALNASCVALGHLRDPAAIPALVRLRTHASDQVRFAVVFALGGFADALAIRTLMEMSSDPDAGVRDWATFALGSLIDVDTPEIRAALLARISDEDEATRGEALVGLARRKDPRVIGPLLKDLQRYQDAEYPGYSLEAAEEIADARLLPILMTLKQAGGPDDTSFDEAIRRCSPGGAADTDGRLSP
jgi:HEAT repeat protein